VTVTQCRSVSMPSAFRRHLVGKTLKNAGYCNNSSDLICSRPRSEGWPHYGRTTLKYALLVSWLSCGHFRKLTNSILCEQLHKSSSFNSTHHAKLHPQHGDRILTIASVTSLHMYNSLHVCKPLRERVL